jgi:hypothetical protein
MVEVRVTNVTECYLTVFSLQWNDTVIILTNITKGNVLEGTGISTSFMIQSLPPSFGGAPSNPNNMLGGVTYTRFGKVHGVTLGASASGLIATLTFQLITTIPATSDFTFLDTVDYPTRWTSSPLASPATTEYQFAWFNEAHDGTTTGGHFSLDIPSFPEPK